MFQNLVVLNFIREFFPGKFLEFLLLAFGSELPLPSRRAEKIGTLMLSFESFIFRLEEHSEKKKVSIVFYFEIELKQKECS